MSYLFSVTVLTTARWIETDGTMAAAFITCGGKLNKCQQRKLRKLVFVFKEFPCDSDWLLNQGIVQPECSRGPCRITLVSTIFSGLHTHVHVRKSWWNQGVAWITVRDTMCVCALYMFYSTAYSVLSECLWKKLHRQLGSGCEPTTSCLRVSNDICTSKHAIVGSNTARVTCEVFHRHSESTEYTVLYTHVSV